MGIKSTKRVYKTTALKMIKDEIDRLTDNASCKEIEDVLENILDIHNEESKYYFDNFIVVPDNYEPNKWEDVY